MTLRIEPARRTWADLVFHVLSHVPSSVPSGLHDAGYVAYCEPLLGPVAGRPLAEDLQALASAASNHERFARLQLLAWLFESIEDEQRHERRPLAELDPEDVADPRLLERIQNAEPEFEILRCAAELEREAHANLPPVSFDVRGAETALSRVLDAAPWLARFSVLAVRPLGSRGRVRDAEVWVGAPGADFGPSPEHAAWQAAHEATVAEVERVVPRPAMSDRPAEHAALVVLAARARECGLMREHANWLAHFGPGLPSLAPESLAEPYRSGIEPLLRTAL